VNAHVTCSRVARSFLAACLAASPVAYVFSGGSAQAASSDEDRDGEAPLIGPPTAGGLTADEAARRAASTSYDVRARAEEVAVAQGSLDQARTKLLPRLSSAARYTRLSPVDDASLGNVVAVGPGVAPGPLPAGTTLSAVPLTFPVYQNQYVLQASLEVPLSDYLFRFPRLLDAAKGNLHAAALLEQATRLSVATEARVSFYRWARAALQANVSAQALAQAQAHLVDARAAQVAGTASKADVLRVESQVASAELQLAHAHTSVVVAEQQLRTVMHDQSTNAYHLGEDLRERPAPSALDKGPQAEPEMIRQAVETRLEARALSLSADAARDDAASTRAAALPRLSAVGNTQYARPNSRIFPQKDEFTRTWDVGLQISFSPTDLFGANAGHRSGMAHGREIDAQRASLADSIGVDVVQSLEALREAETAMSASERGLTAAEESYRVRRLMFRNGRATSVELTDAETELSRAEMDAIGARIDRRIAEVRLVHALGRDADPR